MAYIALLLDTGLRVRSSGREPERASADMGEPSRRNVVVRTLARRRVELRPLGSLPWHGLGRASDVATV